MILHPSCSHPPGPSYHYVVRFSYSSGTPEVIPPRSLVSLVALSLLFPKITAVASGSSEVAVEAVRFLL